MQGEYTCQDGANKTDVGLGCSEELDPKRLLLVQRKCNEQKPFLWIEGELTLE